MYIGRRSKSRLTPDALRLPLIALIDVVLFLLFYFVISFSISAEERELAAAIASPGRSSSPLLSQVVQIEMSEGRPQFLIGGRTFPDRDSLARLLRSLPKEPGVVVKSAAEVPIEAIAAAAQAARDAGFPNISYSPGAPPSGGEAPSSERGSATPPAAPPP